MIQDPKNEKIILEFTVSFHAEIVGGTTPEELTGKSHILHLC